MRCSDIIHEIEAAKAKTERAIRSRLQHALNAMHVYCYLCGFIEKPYALAFARKWERNIIYYNIIYRNNNNS
jgi:hypothetical protein